NKSFSEDIKKRFEAYGWNHILVKDGNDMDEINKAIEEAKSQKGPTIIEVKTIIGYGSPNKSNSNSSHGSPLGEDERELTFKNYELDPSQTFQVDDSVYEIFNETMIQRADEHEAAWKKDLEAYTEKYPELAKEFKTAIAGELPEG
ncbi:transketolase, partial [Staphylococcus hominis]